MNPCQATQMRWHGGAWPPGEPTADAPNSFPGACDFGGLDRGAMLLIMLLKLVAAVSFTGVATSYSMDRL